MEKQDIYKYKAHLQVNNLFFKNIDSFDNYSEKELEDLYFQVKLKVFYGTKKLLLFSYAHNVIQNNSLMRMNI